MQSSKFIQRRFRRILGEARNVRPESDTIRELAELAFALEDEPVPATIIARLTLTKADGTKVIIEVSENATYASFYRLYSQQGNRRSTKKYLRAGSKREGMNLEALAISWTMRAPGNIPIINIRIKIYRKREYRRLISARPDELGLTKCKSNLAVERFAPWAQGGRS